MRRWWRSLQERERRVLVAGAAALVLVLAYGLVWLPFGKSREQAREDLARSEAALTWSRQAAAQIISLRRSARAEPDPRPLLSIVDSTAKGSGLDGVIRRIQPIGQNDVRVSLDGASYRALMAWLVQLHGKGVRAVELSIQRENDPGKVTANLTLNRAG
jgi:general secretion pathway protein M